MNQNEFSKDNYKIVPLRFEDRIEIMKWRNEQIYHLRQAEPLTEESQDNYFRTTVASLFEQENPSQILFSYLKDDVCIGYGGLVHINWIDRHAEISFIMKTELEIYEFEKHWTNFIRLITILAFEDLKLKRIFTYAFDIRPMLYSILEKNRFQLKSRLKNQIEIEGKEVDVLIHERKNPFYLIQPRVITNDDVSMIYEWSNDTLVRIQSFNQEPILFKNHKNWFEDKLNNKDSLLIINEFENVPAGFIKFDIEKEYSTIGILISQDFRGKGLAKDMLIKSSEFYFHKFDKPIWAFIKETNKVSIKSFEQAGYLFSHNQIINQIPSLVYKLDKI